MSAAMDHVKQIENKIIRVKKNGYFATLIYCDFDDEYAIGHLSHCHSLCEKGLAEYMDFICVVYLKLKELNSKE